jgi:hypothetical protein
LSAPRFINHRLQGGFLVSDAVGLFGLCHLEDALCPVRDYLIEAG